MIRKLYVHYRVKKKTALLEGLQAVIRGKKNHVDVSQIAV